MKKNLVILPAIILVFILSVSAVFAQADKSVKIDQKNITVDAEKLFDAKKIGKQVSSIEDIGVTGAYVSWVNFGKNGFELDVDPILTKNSKDAKIYVKNDKGEYGGGFQVRVEALDKDGKIIEKQDKDFLGWTVEETEAVPFDFRFRSDTWKKTASFRITVDPKNLLKEAFTKNNSVIIKPPSFTGKEYSTKVYPAREK